MKENTMLALTLEQIAKRNLGAQGRIEIPPVQRGLVWSAVRAEVLWDSILRGLPIGTFSVHKAKDGIYELLDGQQRSNAIAMAFSFDDLRELTPTALKEVRKAICEGNECRLKDVALRPMLWIDLGKSGAVKVTGLAGETEQKSNRAYFLKVTTAANPWGYGDGESETNNDVLDLKSQMAALDDFERRGCGKWGLAERPLPYEVWPSGAVLPVPMAVVVQFASEKKDDASGRDFDSFCDWCQDLDGVKNANWFVANEFILKADRLNVEDAWNRILSCLVKRLEGTRIAALVADVEPRDVGLYFSRMNRAGVVPTVEDIQYSLLKDALKDVVERKIWNEMDEQASRLCVKPSRLVNIAVRHVMNEGKDVPECLTGEIPLSKLMALKNSFAKFVGERSFFELLEKARKDFCGEATPAPLAWLLSDLASRDDGLALLWLLRMEASGSRLPGRLTVCGFMTCLQWFSEDLSSVVAALWPYANDLKSGIYRALRLHGGLRFPLRRDEIEFVLADASETDLSGFMALFDDDVKPRLNAFMNGFDKGSHGGAMLLFACREYLQKMFGTCLPGQPQWMEQNRPWDIDHLLPKSWLDKMSGTASHDSLIRSLAWSIGNAVPIPFQVNRSKSDKPADELYPFATYAVPDWCKSAEGAIAYAKLGLHLNAEIVGLGRRTSAAGAESWFDDDSNCREFCRLTIKRMFALYLDWYETCGIESVLDVMDSDAARNDRRNQVFEAAAKRCRELGLEGECKLWYVSGNKEYAVMRPIDLAHPWVTLGVRTKDGKAMVALTSNDYDGLDWEVGLRKGPSLPSVDKAYGEDLQKKCETAPFDGQFVNAEWWYYFLSSKFRRNRSFSLSDAMERHFKHFLDACEKAQSLGLV